MQRTGPTTEQARRYRDPQAARYSAAVAHEPRRTDQRTDELVEAEEVSEEMPEEVPEEMIDAEMLVEEEPSLARLVGELVADAQHVVRKELELVKVEFQGEVEKLKQSVITFTLGAGIAAAGGLLVLFMAVYLIAGAGLGLWLSYLIVGGTCLLIGGIMLAVGRSRARDVDMVPRETVASLRKDVQWIREQSPSSKR